MMFIITYKFKSYTLLGCKLKIRKIRKIKITYNAFFFIVHEKEMENSRFKTLIEGIVIIFVMLAL
jgi:hypothetical protein